MICPMCGKENEDDWPLELDGEIRAGGCQDCWERECSTKWWEMVEAIYRATGVFT